MFEPTCQACPRRGISDKCEPTLEAFCRYRIPGKCHLRREGESDMAVTSLETSSREAERHHLRLHYEIPLCLRWKAGIQTTDCTLLLTIRWGSTDAFMKLTKGSICWTYWRGTVRHVVVPYVWCTFTERVVTYQFITLLPSFYNRWVMSCFAAAGSYFSTTLILALNASFLNN